MTTAPRIARPFAFSTTGGSSFDRELRGLLWSRVLKVTSIGLGISLLFTLVARYLLEIEPAGLNLEAPWLRRLTFAHAGSFAVGLLVLLTLRRWLCHIKLMVFVWLLMAFNLGVGVLTAGMCRPDQQPFFEVALILFLPAALVPWRLAFQVSLGVFALAGYLFVQIYYLRFAVYADLWSGRGGLDAFIDHLVMGVTGIVVFGAVSTIASRTLYSLRRTVHEAERLGNYMIREELGRGGMGKVFLAEHALIRRPTAVKVLEAPEGEAEAALVRFEQEVQLSASLTHPNTINIFDYGRTADGVFYYAMEHLDGLDLQAWVEKYGPLPPERVVHVLLQICGSLLEAHGRGIVHRDIKPSNIFLTQRGGLCDFVKVLDFGLAKKVSAGAPGDLTRTGVIFGTPRYMAPEAIADRELHDPRSDLYNLGGVAYWLLTGQPPFTSKSSVELIVDHVKTVPTPPSRISETPVPPELDALVMRLLEKKPENRFPCAATLRAALRAVPLAEPWNEDRARQWWELHGLWHEAEKACAVAGAAERPEEVAAARRDAG